MSLIVSYSRATKSRTTTSIVSSEKLNNGWDSERVLFLWQKIEINRKFG